MTCGLGIAVAITFYARNNTKLAGKLASEGSFAMNDGDFEGAFQKMERASIVKPNVAEYHVGAGMAAIKLSKLNDAIRHYQSADQILSVQSASDPERVDDHALVLFLLERDQQALDVIQSGIKRFPESAMLKRLATNTNSFAEMAQEFGIRNTEPPLSPFE